MKISVDYRRRGNRGEAFKDQPPKIVSEEEFSRMCKDENCFIVRTKLVLNESERKRAERLVENMKEEKGEKKGKKKGREEGR